VEPSDGRCSNESDNWWGVPLVDVDFSERTYSLGAFGDRNGRFYSLGALGDRSMRICTIRDLCDRSGRIYNVEFPCDRSRGVTVGSSV
jgi:hypothetical protein